MPSCTFTERVGTAFFRSPKPLSLFVVWCEERTRHVRVPLSWYWRRSNVRTRSGPSAQLLGASDNWMVTAVLSYQSLCICTTLQHTVVFLVQLEEVELTFGSWTKQGTHEHRRRQRSTRDRSLGRGALTPLFAMATKEALLSARSRACRCRSTSSSFFFFFLSAPLPFSLWFSQLGTHEVPAQKVKRPT